MCSDIFHRVPEKIDKSGVNMTPLGIPSVKHSYNLRIICRMFCPKFGLRAVKGTDLVALNAYLLRKH